MVNVITDVSKDHTAFIVSAKYFKERYGEREIYFECLTLKKMAQRSFETSVSIYR
jgi:hypothetical protein